MQAPGDPTPKKGKAGTEDRRPQRDEERFHHITSLGSTPTSGQQHELSNLKHFVRMLFASNTVNQ
jgi:hypothetical protein